MFRVSSPLLSKDMKFEINLTADGKSHSLTEIELTLIPQVGAKIVDMNNQDHVIEKIEIRLWPRQSDD